MPFVICNVLELVAVLPAQRISRLQKQLITVHIYMYHAMTSNGHNSYYYNSKGASQLMWYKERQSLGLGQTSARLSPRTTLFGSMVSYFNVIMYIT